MMMIMISSSAEVLPEHPSPLPEHGCALLHNCSAAHTVLLAHHHKALGDDPPEPGVASKACQVPVVGLLENVQLVSNECLQVQVQGHLLQTFMLYFHVEVFIT